MTALQRACRLVSDVASARDLDARYTEHTGRVGVLTYCFADERELETFVDGASKTIAPLDIGRFTFIDADELARQNKLVALLGAAALNRRGIVALSVRGADSLVTAFDWQRDADEDAPPPRHSRVVDGSSVRLQALGVDARPPATVCAHLAAHAQRCAAASDDRETLRVYFIKYSVDLASGDVCVDECECARAEDALENVAAVPNGYAAGLRALVDGADPRRVIVVSAMETSSVYALASWHVALRGGAQ